MTHILGMVDDVHTHHFRKPVGAVRVRRESGTRLVIDTDDKGQCFSIVPGDIAWYLLPEKIQVFGVEGRIKPSGRFWITTHSIDPYHLVTDQP